jgi:TetR/AcrR family transcriptional regulator, transcriptional repressor for nem operon
MIFLFQIMVSVMAQNESFLTIIEQAELMFRVKGYHNTSIADIAKACGLNKSSIYHHVTSKKDLVFKVVQHVHERFARQVIVTAYNSQFEAETTLEKFLVATENYFADKRGGCLVANLVLELAAHDHDFNQVFEPFFNDWCAALEHVLASLAAEAMAKRIAIEALALLQGLLMLQQVYADLSANVSIAKRVMTQVINNLSVVPSPANT